MDNQQTGLQLTFLGGAGTVTGSKILLKTQTYQILIDCGLFQGIKELRLLNWRKPSLEIDKLDAVLLTHGHLDHCGYLPVLVKYGFDAPIYATEPTKEVTEVILRDSAKIQEEDAGRANKYGYTKHHPAKPLYNEHDVERTMPLFKTVAQDKWIELKDDFKFRFLNSGHILGSSFIEVECQGQKIVFSGDIGRRKPLLMHPPALVSETDYLVLESTYGDRLHSETSPYQEIKDIVHHAYNKDGILIIPSFAVERAQEILLILNTLRDEKSIPDIPIYLDTPMGINITELYLKYRKWHSLSEAECKTMMHNIHLIRDFAETLQVLDKKGPKIVIAGSGMVTGGRVLYYLEQLLSDEKNTVLLVGFQAPGTRGSLLSSGTNDLKIHGNYYTVRAEVKQIGSLSAHADQAELLWWLSHFKKAPKRVFLNHGEPQASDELRLKIIDTLGWDVTVTKMNEPYEL